jgi:Tol biopolymer transport system component
MKIRMVFSAGWLTLALTLCGAPAGALGAALCTLDRATGTTIDANPYIAGGYVTRWNFATGRLVYMAPNPDGYYRVYVVPAIGGTPQELTRNTPGVPTTHMGLPYWHPSGRYVVFIAQKQQWHGARMFDNPDYGAIPGWGVHDDIWVATADGAHAWKLTHEENTKFEGELMPVFSPDGRYLAWSSRQPDKSYILKVAEFIEAPAPHLENTREYTPGGRVYYEPGSFTSDGSALAYTSDQDTGSFWASQIHLLDLASGKSRRLTQGRHYNEHPIVMNTPDGDWVVYMSTKNEQQRFMRAPGTDWWAVRTDGTGEKRLTYMNIHARDNPQDNGHTLTAITSAISPQGDFMLADVQDSLTRQTGYVRVVRFTCGRP